MGLAISDTVTVITGASSGIGRATALRLAGRRGTVVLASRQPEALREVALECRERGGQALAVPTDVTDEEQVQELGRQAIAAFGRIDVWVNDAAVTMLGRFEESPPEAFRRVIDTNFFGYVHGVRAALPYFREQGHGILINVASVVSRVGNPFATAYAASKAAVLAFSESLRMELRDTPGIRVCNVLPATIDTPLFQHAANFAGRAVRAMPPVYAPEEVAEAIVDLIHHPRREVKVGNAGRMIALRALLPRALTEWAMARKIEREHFQNRPSRPSIGNVFQPQPELNAVHGGWMENGGAPSAARIGGTLAVAAGLGLLAYYLASRPHPAEPRRVMRVPRAVGT
jgi:NAD(P)-dependent dehydrogenase (short-subunit alcohol dehydrogenase family)